MFSHLREKIRQRRRRKDLYSTQAYWDSKAATYDDTAVSMWTNQALNQLYEAEQKAWIRRLMGSAAGCSLLDLGCGTGRFSRWFSEQGGKVTGIDFSSGALEIAKRLSAGSNPAYRHGSVFELTEENAYDVAFTWGVLTIACRDKDQLLDALIRIRRTLRSNGRLFLTEPIHRGFLHRVLDLNLSGFLAVMREAGFRVETTTPLHFWPMRLALAYVQWPAWITTPLYHVGQALMRLPGISGLGDYWAIIAYPLSASAKTGSPGQDGV